MTYPSKKARLRQHIIYICLLTCVAGLTLTLSHRFTYQWDATSNNRHTLSAPTQQLLALLEEPLTFTSYLSSASPKRLAIQRLLERYQRHRADIKLRFVTTETHPNEVRELNIQGDGELIIQYQGRQQRLQQLSEQQISLAIQRLISHQQQTVRFLNAHGERDIDNDNNSAVSFFAKRLQKKGFHVETLNLVLTPRIPEDTDLVVIASPTSDYFPGEFVALQQYLDQGGNLLWMKDPDSAALAPLSQHLDIQWLPGTVVDAASEVLKLDTPDFAIINQYPANTLSSTLKQTTLFPQASALQLSLTGTFLATPFLQTQPKSWTELGPIEGRIRHDASQGEQAGPLVIGAQLEAQRSDKTQRIVLLGDSDFISNTYLGNGGNQALGEQLFNWLSGDDQFLTINLVSPEDTTLNFTTAQMTGLAFSLLILIPLLLFSISYIIWKKRHRRRL